MNFKNFTFSPKHQLILLVLLALGLNFNTLFNEYAIDDGYVMTENSLVEKGIKGIPEILTTNLLHGNKGLSSTFSEARYRPVGLVVFALEYQFFRANPMVSHLINVILFALLISLLYRLLQSTIFREQHKMLAFITCLLFVVHPIHTEVIANIKSRDELITFLFLIASLFTLIRHVETKKRWLLFTGLFCFFLALLTRESAVTFIGIVPLVLYFFFNHSIKKSILFSIPLIVTFICYLSLRFMIVGFNNSNNVDIGNAPFLFATTSQAFATKVFILLKYIWLLIFPYPLSWEYGYNQIPYIEVYSIKFALSLLVLIGLFSYAIFSFNKKSIFSFALLYFFITISLVANFVIDIGTPLSERLLFQPSLAFCILVAAIYIKANTKTTFFANAVLLFILLLFSSKTISRNAEWKNNETLCFADVVSSPNSIRANMAAASIYLTKTNNETNNEVRKDYFKKSIYYSMCALKIYPKNPRVHLDLIFAYRKLFGCYQSAGLFIKDNNLILPGPEEKRILEVLSDDIYNKGNEFFERSNYGVAIQCYQECVKLNSAHVAAWYNLGGNYFLMNDTINGMKAWERVKELDPNHPLKKQDFL